MKYIRFLKTFFRLLAEQNVWETISGKCEPTKHFYKTRIGFSTAYKVAKIQHL